MDETSLIEKSQKPFFLAQQVTTKTCSESFPSFFFSVCYGAWASSKRLLEGSTQPIPAYYYKIKAIKLLPSIFPSSLLLFFTSFVNIEEQRRTWSNNVWSIERRRRYISGLDTSYNVSKSPDAELSYTGLHAPSLTRPILQTVLRSSQRFKNDYFERARDTFGINLREQGKRVVSRCVSAPYDMIKGYFGEKFWGTIRSPLISIYHFLKKNKTKTKQF